jgi:hypothetical protein
MFLMNRKKRVNVKPYDVIEFKKNLVNKVALETISKYTGDVIEKARKAIN